MSIRYRLLFIVGFVASVVFISAFFINNHLLKNSLDKSRKEALDFEKKVVEEKRDSIATLISDEMAMRLAQINALLETVSQYPSLASWFAPTSENLESGTWIYAAHFLQDEDWIQFIQNTTEGKLLSLIIPESSPFFDTENFPIEENISWVVIKDSMAYPDPCIGIQLSFFSKDDQTEEDPVMFLAGEVPNIQVLFTVDHLKALNLSFYDLKRTQSILQETALQGYEIDEERFFSLLSRAQTLVTQPGFTIPLPETFKKNVKEELPVEERSSSEKYLEQILEYSHELFVIEKAVYLKQARIFGDSWPDGLSFTKKDHITGKVVFLKSILEFPKPVFNDKAFYEKYPPNSGNSFVSSGCAIIKSPHPDQAFFVNTACLSFMLEGKKKESFLTIGFDVSDLLYTLVSISGHYGCMVSGGRVIASTSPEEKPSVPFKWVPQAIGDRTSSQGSMTLGDEEYYFMTIRPLEELDLYFCLFLPLKEELSLFTKAQEKIGAILHHAWVQKIILELASLLILWILLSNLSKKITDPIVALSKTLRYVKIGDWDRVKIPDIRLSRNNEIKQLVQSFQDMVEGMKEKEKMSGVLNKVVSKEIAQEILRGDVHLGGEEKEVTMLFADIRGFTQLTQNMLPHDIIHLLNTCMTKLSQVIEENKGVIDKYLGDGIMALYGAPVAYADSPLYAVMSAVEMLSTMKAWDEERVHKGLPPLNIGIGIHTGTVCAGNMGALNRLNYTVIGSHVNMASRLCYASGPGEILITADTYLQPCVQKNINVEDQGFMSFKGFDEKKQVYKVLGLKDANLGKVLIVQGNE